ncbi:glycosyltransferase 87 family protein [Kitasatospora sp. NBC_00240]|uniref:glycosyltransferase 87 family protein n=1 Tax=Kitasatospora sp. NBC_00240 TaxID=2903567 RepID=UPI0022591FF0|nr:glycosyltransferase 87 family protein [Kitasatospora sp. NBC_00240]MCX5214412.1 glycosyltransferase 87 family protein [Kitasatospora sp. NBC_00240]
MPGSPPVHRRAATLACCLALAALVASSALTVTGGGTLGARRPLYAWYAVDALLFALAVALLRRVPVRQAGRLVLAGSVLVAAVGLLAPPRTSDDAYRYVWDGQVQQAGLSPYAYAPDDPALAGLRARAPGLFPVGDGCDGWDERRAAGGFCSRLNRPNVRTIYPPVAELWFAGLHRVAGGWGVRAAQAGGALLAVVTTGVLLAALRRRPGAPGRALWRAALWGWCPGVAVWAVNDAHVDVLGALLMVAGLVLAGRGRAGAGGALLGAATATKLLPALALPGAMSGLLARRPRPRDLVLPLSALGVFVLGYLPYVVASGAGVLGYLPGYLREEGYDQDRIDRFALVRLLLPDRLAPYGAALVLLALVLHVLRRGDPERPWRGALLVTGGALLAVTPGYPWYGLLVVALVGLDGRWEWLAVPAAGQVVYLLGGGAQRWAYAVALAVVLAGAVGRRAGRPGAGTPAGASGAVPGAASTGASPGASTGASVTNGRGKGRARVFGPGR